MKTIKSYKGFNKDLTCRGFQYEIGKEYECEEVKICEEGFHACENPFDVLIYYNLCESEFGEVEQSGKIAKHDDDSKVASTKIKVTAKIGLAGFVKACVDFLLEKNGESKEKVASGNYSQLAASGFSSQLASSGFSSKLAVSGDSSQLAASGFSSKLASSGNYSQLAASGNYSQLAASGNYSQLAASGFSSKLAVSGDSSQLAVSGDSSKLASSGNSSQLAASGFSSKLASSGNSSQLEMTGSDSVGAAIGIDNIIKGKKGCWITLAEWEYDEDKKRYIPICVKSEQIDGKKIKADTFYTLKNGKFVKVK